MSRCGTPAYHNPWRPRAVSTAISSQRRRYVKAFGKHPGIIIQDQQPFNAESPLGPLRKTER